MKIWELLDSENVGKLYTSENLGIILRVHIFSQYPYAVVSDTLDNITHDYIGDKLEEVFPLIDILKADFKEV